MYEHIDKASQKSEVIARKYRVYARNAIVMMFLLVASLASLLVVHIFLLPQIESEVLSYLRDRTLQLMVYAIHFFLLLLSATILHYSLRQEEKYQQIYFTYLRLIIALHVSSEEKHDEIQKAIITNLFDIDSKKREGTFEKDVYSGHPVVDKLLDIIKNFANRSSGQ